MILYTHKSRGGQINKRKHNLILYNITSNGKCMVSDSGSMAVCSLYYTYGKRKKKNKIKIAKGKK